MKIEDEIQQYTFKSPHQKLAINLLFTANWIERHQREFLKEFGITLQQFNILRILRGQYPQPVSLLDIRVRMIDRMSDVSRLIERLRQVRLVSRDECHSDRRLVDVKITEAGLDILKAIDQRENELNKVMHSLATEEIQAMNLLLDKLRLSEE